MTKENLEEASGGRNREDWFEEKNALNRARWRDIVRAIAEEIGCILPSLLRGQHQIKKSE